MVNWVGLEVLHEGEGDSSNPDDAFLNHFLAGVFPPFREVDFIDALTKRDCRLALARLDVPAHVGGGKSQRVETFVEALFDRIVGVFKVLKKNVRCRNAFGKFIAFGFVGVHSDKAQ